MIGGDGVQAGEKKENKVPFSKTALTTRRHDWVGTTGRKSTDRSIMTPDCEKCAIQTGRPALPGIF
ncbi:MAG: hypothetical protein CME88_14635 [Hirschia sp.]|nr:hypothetical protein [Hirschia sp.]MBF19611.1 hypothetical protein [Hirschia sp.]|tara:strand:- start:309 stop:506 length:198 start_codon:yes stop_codon:yes gene_type:complete